MEDTLLSSTLRAVPYRCVLMLANHNSFVSAAHTDDDIAATVHAVHQAARHLDTRV